MLVSARRRWGCLLPGGLDKLGCCVTWLSETVAQAVLEALAAQDNDVNARRPIVIAQHAKIGHESNSREVGKRDEETDCGCRLPNYRHSLSGKTFAVVHKPLGGSRPFHDGGPKRAGQDL
jgi:hypothetical protein